jgi:hypothetical protein
VAAAAPTHETPSLESLAGICAQAVAAAAAKEALSAAPSSGSVPLSMSNARPDRGTYKCSRCGRPKKDHVCAAPENLSAAERKRKFELEHPRGGYGYVPRMGPFAPGMGPLARAPGFSGSYMHPSMMAQHMMAQQQSLCHRGMGMGSAAGMGMGVGMRGSEMFMGAAGMHGEAHPCTSAPYGYGAMPSGASPPYPQFPSAQPGHHYGPGAMPDVPPAYTQVAMPGMYPSTNMSGYPPSLYMQPGKSPGMGQQQYQSHHMPGRYPGPPVPPSGM